MSTHNSITHVKSLVFAAVALMFLFLSATLAAGIDQSDKVTVTNSTMARPILVSEKTGEIPPKLHLKPLLANIPMDSTTGLLFVYDAWWTNLHDADTDSHTCTRQLNIDIDLIGEDTRSVYYKVYGRPGPVSPWNIWATSSSYTIVGQSPDNHALTFTPNCNHATYEMEVRAYFAGSSTAETIYGQADDIDLKTTNWELPDEDALDSVYVYNVSWTDELDADADGYTQARRIHVDLDLNVSRTRNVFYTVFARSAIGGDWKLWASSSIYSVTGTQPESHALTFTPDTRHGTYDIEVRAHLTGNNNVQDYYGPGDNSDLNNETWEKPSDDLNGTEISLNPSNAMLREPACRAWQTDFGLIIMDKACY